MDDPPSQLIGRFLHSQKASGCDVSLDMDLEMEELQRELAPVSGSPIPLPPSVAPEPNASIENRVFFQPSGSGGAAGTANETPTRRRG